jgi:hypothetical protein
MHSRFDRTTDQPKPEEWRLGILIMQGINNHGQEEEGNLSDRKQDTTDQVDRVQEPLPKKITEHIQRIRNELKKYEEPKKVL